MSPETNVEYPASPNFPVLKTEFLDFFPGQVPGKSMVIYESRKPVLGDYDPECIFIRNHSPEFSVLYPSSEHSQGIFLSAPKDKAGHYYWINQSGQRINVVRMFCSENGGGFRKNLPLWAVNENKLVKLFPNTFVDLGKFVASEAGIAVIPVISESLVDHSGLIFCDQSDLAKPEVKSFLEEILGGTKRLPLKETQMDIPILAEAVKV